MDGFLLLQRHDLYVAQISKSDPHSGLLIERLAVSVRERVG